MCQTIDNDVGDSEFKLIDHTPGYGSVARYWAYMTHSANEENAGSSPSDPVLVMQAMGRRIGYIPAAARLGDPQRELPLLILLAESKLGLPAIADLVNDKLPAWPRHRGGSEGASNWAIWGDQGLFWAHGLFGLTDHGGTDRSQLSEQRGPAHYWRCTVRHLWRAPAPQHYLCLDRRSGEPMPLGGGASGCEGASGYMATRGGLAIYHVHDKAPLELVAARSASYRAVDQRRPRGCHRQFVAMRDRSTWRGLASVPLVNGFSGSRG